jgi:hypothetical protein
MMFVVNNRQYFISNNDCHGTNTRQSNNLHLPQVNLTLLKMAVYYSGGKIFNNLPLKVEGISHDPKKFKPRLKEFYSYSFYTLEEFFNRTMYALFGLFLRSYCCILWCLCILSTL